MAQAVMDRPAPEVSACLVSAMAHSVAARATRSTGKTASQDRQAAMREGTIRTDGGNQVSFGRGLSSWTTSGVGQEAGDLRHGVGDPERMRPLVVTEAGRR